MSVAAKCDQTIDFLRCRVQCSASLEIAMGRTAYFCTGRCINYHLISMNILLVSKTATYAMNVIFYYYLQAMYMTVNSLDGN